MECKLNELELTLMSTQIAEHLKGKLESYGEFRLVDEFKNKGEAVNVREDVGYSIFDVLFYSLSDKRNQSVPERLKQKGLSELYQLKKLTEREGDRYAETYQRFTDKVLKDAVFPGFIGINFITPRANSYFEFIKSDVGDNYRIFEGKNGKTLTIMCDEDNRKLVYGAFANLEIFHSAISISQFEKKRQWLIPN